MVQTAHFLGLLAMVVIPQFKALRKVTHSEGVVQKAESIVAMVPMPNTAEVAEEAAVTQILATQRLEGRVFMVQEGAVEATVTEVQLGAQMAEPGVVIPLVEAVMVMTTRQQMRLELQEHPESSDVVMAEVAVLYGEAQAEMAERQVVAAEGEVVLPLAIHQAQAVTEPEAR